MSSMTIKDIRRCVVEKVCPFCKTKVESTEQLQTHMQENDHCKVHQNADFFKESQYLFPTYENDTLLTAFDIGDTSNLGNLDAHEQEQIKKSQEELSRRREQLARELERMGLSKEVELVQLPWGNNAKSHSNSHQNK